MVFLIILATIEWLALLAALYFGLVFGLGTLGHVSSIVWIVTIIGVGYPVLFGIVLFLFRKELARRKLFWFTIAFNVFPVFWFFIVQLLDRIGLY